MKLVLHKIIITYCQNVAQHKGILQLHIKRVLKYKDNSPDYSDVITVNNYDSSVYNNVTTAYTCNDIDVAYKRKTYS